MNKDLQVLKKVLIKKKLFNKTFQNQDISIFLNFFVLLKGG